MNSLLDAFTFLPQEFPVFSQTGCKQVSLLSSSSGCQVNILRWRVGLIFTWAAGLEIYSSGQGSFSRALNLIYKVQRRARTDMLGTCQIILNTSHAVCSIEMLSLQKKVFASLSFQCKLYQWNILWHLGVMLPQIFWTSSTIFDIQSVVDDLNKASAIETCICLNSIFWPTSELQSQDEHPMCEDWGLDEHATLQPPLPPRKLPNEVKSSYVVTPMYWIFMSGTTCTMDSLGLSWATLPRTIRGKLLVTS